MAGDVLPDRWLALLIVDDAGRVIACDASLAELTAAVLDDDSADPCAFLAGRLSPTDGLRRAVCACLETGAPVLFDLQFHDATGHTRDLSALASPLLLTPSRATGAPPVDASRLAVVILQPAPSSPPACSPEDHRAELRRVIGEIAHELSRPLAAVLNYAELALLDPDLSEAARARIAMVVQHAEACRQVVRHSLEMGVAGARPTEPVDVNAVVQRTVASLSHILGSTQIDLALDPSVPAVWGSVQDLGAAIGNLLENAVHAASESSESPRVDVATAPTDAGVRLTIRDNGPGIDPSIADRLFEPFVSTKEADRGTGLGLSIVRRIILDHEGQVTATSLPMGGTAFTVDLPASRGGAVSPAPTAPVEVAAPSEGAAPLRALLIDDDASMCKLLGTYLDTLGYQSTEVGDGLQGLRQALAEDYDVIVCDVKMPSMDGLEFYRHLSAESPERASRVIFSTGVLPTDPADADLRTLPNPCLRKPYRLASLKTALSALLPRR